MTRQAPSITANETVFKKLYLDSASYMCDSLEELRQGVAKGQQQHKAEQAGSQVIEILLSQVHAGCRGLGALQ